MIISVLADILTAYFVFVIALLLFYANRPR